MCGFNTNDSDRHLDGTQRDPEMKFKQPDRNNNETAPRALDDLSELLEVNKQILATLKAMSLR